jgi:hypothetical protein
MTAKKKGKPGRKPERLIVSGNWKDAIKRAIGRGKPPKGKPKKKIK